MGLAPYIMIEREINYNHVFLGQRYLAKLDFMSQYNSLYRARLKALKERCLSNSREDPDFNFLTEIMEAKTNQSCVIAGVIVRTYKSRQSIIDKYIVKVGTLEAHQATGKITSSNKDQIFLEDESGRVKLDIINSYQKCQELFTGVVVAIRGVMRENSVMEVIEVSYPSAELPRLLTRKGDEYLCFLSGLEIGNPKYDIILLHLLTSFFQGNLGSESAEIARKVVRVVILGNSL